MPKLAGVFAAGAAAVLVAGCGENSGTESASNPAAAGNAGSAAARPGRPADPSNDFVRAASSGKAGDPIELKFDIPAKPDAGKPIEINILFVAAPEIKRLQATFDAGYGITFRSGDLPVSFDKLNAEAPARHRVVVQAERDGIFMLTATVLADSDNASLNRTFSIPVIVGSGVAAP